MLTPQVDVASVDDVGGLEAAAHERCVSGEEVVVAGSFCAVCAQEDVHVAEGEVVVDDVG